MSRYPFSAARETLADRLLPQWLEHRRLVGFQQLQRYFGRGSCFQRSRSRSQRDCRGFVTVGLDRPGELASLLGLECRLTLASSCRPLLLPLMATSAVTRRMGRALTGRRFVGFPSSLARKPSSPRLAPLQWASGTTVGTTLTLTWSSAISITQVVLYDRPNLSDQITGGMLTFDDGSSVTFGALVNDGSATYVNLTSAVTTSSLLLTVTSVSSTTSSAGLAEIEVFGWGR